MPEPERTNQPPSPALRRGQGALRARRGGGLTLLEVLLALSIVVMVGAGVLAIVHQSIRTAASLRIEAQTADLAVSLLAELNLGILPEGATGPESFDPPFEDWTWRIEPMQADLGQTESDMVEAILTHEPTGYILRLAGHHAPPAADEFELAGVTP